MNGSIWEPLIAAAAAFMVAATPVAVAFLSAQQKAMEARLTAQHEQLLEKVSVNAVQIAGVRGAAAAMRNVKRPAVERRGMEPK